MSVPNASRPVLITGAGRGIGAACARRAAAAGHPVCVNFVRDEGAAQALVAELAGAGGRAVAIRADVSVEADVVRLFAECDRAIGAPWALVNNAGVVAPAGRVDGMDSERILRVLKINVVGPFLAAREAIRRMSTRHGGRGGVIVNLSSVASRIGGAGEYVDYAASKGAIDTMTVGLARELAAEGIRVAAVRPGLIATDIHDSQGGHGRLERLAPTVPVGRAGTADEIASAVLWLLGDDAAYATGAIIDVAGAR